MSNIKYSDQYFKNAGNDGNTPDSKDNQSFTSLKLRWMTAIMSTGFTAFDKCVAFIIMNAINEKTRDWKLSDETIAALMGRPGSARRVRDSRNRLRNAGWIGWKRTKDANVYFLRHENMWTAMDQIMQGRMARRERRKERAAQAARGRLQTATSGPQTYSEDIHEKKNDIIPRRDKNKRAQVIKLEEAAAAAYLPLWSDSALARMPDGLAYLVRLGEAGRWKH